MKKIILTTKELQETVNLEEINKDFTSIFAKREGKLRGMIYHQTKGWILLIGRSRGAYGYFDNLEDCLREGSEVYKYEFFIESE